MSSAIAWFEIATADIQRAQRFYEEIFAIQMRPMDLGELKMVLFPQERGGGALVHNAAFYKPSGDGALLYLSADPDLDIVMKRVEKAGGKVVVPKRQISPDYGYMGIFTDSEGNRMALHSMK
jgi:uncharacterized protein